MGIRELVKQVLIEKENRRYRKLLEKRSVTYERWLAAREEKIAVKLKARKQVSLLSADGQRDYEIFRISGGELSRYADEVIACYFAEHPEVQLLYGDEDVLAQGNPWFKPDWSPDLFDSWYYFGSVVALRREALEKQPCPVETRRENGYFVIKAEKKEPFIKWVRGCAEACGGWKRGCKSIGHVPEILFHCDSDEILSRYMKWETGDTKIFSADGFSVKNADILGQAQGLSIVIPSKDHPDILRQCLKAIPKAAGTLPYEIIVVDNGSKDANKKQIEDLLQNFEKETHSDCAVKYIYHPMEFNFSKMCNMGAQKAEGKLLLFLNDDVELCQENCLAELAKLAEREYVGAVGVKLYYPDSVKIQHAGITNLPMGPVHKLQFLEDDTTYYFNANRKKRNVLAVTAACLMVEKKKYLEVQGFSEELRVAFNDVDFCFKLYEQGYSNVCDNSVFAYHHESLSRGDDESLEKWKRLLEERDKLYANHPVLEGRDPYYGVGLGREGLDTRIRPEYETAGNEIQQLTLSGKATVRKLTHEKVVAYRQDNCLLLRIENCRQGILQGYGVVLGDNNACYEKELVLEPLEYNFAENAEKTSVIYYSVAMKGQYRPDLVENMPDQTNVGLSGFWIGVKEDSSLPKGQYRIGMTVRNRVTGLKLINWSNRIFTVE